MTIEVALVLSAVSVAFSLYSGISNLKRSERSETKTDTSQLTTVIVKLENIGEGITEIKSEMNGIKNDTKENRERIIRSEEAIRQIQETIKQMNKKIEIVYSKQE